MPPADHASLDALTLPNHVRYVSTSEALGNLPPDVRRVPGPASQAYVDRLAASECPAFTARRRRRAEISGAPQDPIVWQYAKGANVVDVDGNRFVDFTAGFAVAAIGHAHPSVLKAIADQSARLLHALGDLHPSDQKIELLERLCQLAPWGDARAALCQSGSEAVEIALKTAALHSARPGVLAFEGGYHGLAHGPLAACGYSDAFRRPFAEQLNPHVEFAPFGQDPGPLGPNIGAILVEPILGRGGVVVPPPEFLEQLRKRADDAGAVLIVDEIFTGLGRCGVRFVSGELADLLCIGKALGGGLPVSACVGRTEIMNAWGDPDGAAIHTGTFYGHPLGCAAALASLQVLEDERLTERALRIGAQLRAALEPLGEVRGVGLMLGFVPRVRSSAGVSSAGVPSSAEGAEPTVLPLVARLMSRGYLTLPAGPDANVLQLVPPLTIAEELLGPFAQALGEELR